MIGRFRGFFCFFGVGDGLFGWNVGSVCLFGLISGRSLSRVLG